MVGNIKQRVSEQKRERERVHYVQQKKHHWPQKKSFNQVN